METIDDFFKENANKIKSKNDVLNFFNAFFAITDAPKYSPFNKKIESALIKEYYRAYNLIKTPEVKKYLQKCVSDMHLNV